MGAGGEREKGSGRAARWAEERNELISDNGVKGRGEQHPPIVEAAAGMSPSVGESRKRMHASKALRMRGDAAAVTAAMDVDEETRPSAPVWEGNASPSREVVVYRAEENGPGASPGRVSSGHGKSPTLTRIRSVPPIAPAEDQEPTDGRHSRSRHPKSPRSPRRPKSNTSAPPEFSQSRLRQTTLRSRGQSPRRTRVEEDELQDVLAEIIHDQSLTLARAARRQKKQGNRDGQIPVNDPASGRVSPARSVGSSLRPPGSTGDPLEESPGKPGRRTKTRRQKRKADVVHENHDSFPDDIVMEDRVPAFHPLQGLQDFVSRAAARKESSSTSNTWMDLFADVIMWRDVPRSTLMFGAGCFCILSASFIRDVRCGSLTFAAYLALVYLAGVFVHRNFLRGGAILLESRSWELGETETLEMLKVVLPAVNLILRKCGQLFCGDPSTTLKVASILWLLAQAGYIMTIWSLFRFGFLLMFVIPKFYSCYSFQLHGQAEAYADRLWNAWSAYAHKKAAIFGALVVAWNLSSATSRLYGVFLLLVAIKIYTHHLADQVNDQTETDHPLPVSEQPEEGPATPPHVHYTPLPDLPSCKKIEAG